MADQHPIPKHPLFKDLTGRRFGRLIVLAYAGKRGASRHFWLCRCDCGKERVVRGSHMIQGRTGSCGCLSRELSIARSTKHSMSYSAEWGIWSGMKKRCYNESDQAYPNYGGRGIRVYDRWLESFENFLADMGTRPSKRHSLERRNNNGNYEPSNVYWATRRQQNRNKRNNRLITHNGLTLTLSEWAEQIGISPGTLKMRLRMGWSIERALTQPCRFAKQQRA